jgi:hypothetical protein
MPNNSINITIITEVRTLFSAKLFVAYCSLTVTVVDTIFGIRTFIVLCRLTFRNTKTRFTLSLIFLYYTDGISSAWFRVVCLY